MTTGLRNVSSWSPGTRTATLPLRTRDTSNEREIGTFQMAKYLVSPRMFLSTNICQQHLTKRKIKMNYSRIATFERRVFKTTTKQNVEKYKMYIQITAHIFIRSVEYVETDDDIPTKEQTHHGKIEKPPEYVVHLGLLAGVRALQHGAQRLIDPLSSSPHVSSPLLVQESLLGPREAGDSS